jgi:inner membrane protein
MSPSGAINSIKNSQLTRIILICVLVLLLQIPTLMLQGLVTDRESLRQSVITEVTDGWGRQQTVTGPRLIVPYVKQSQKSDGKIQRTVLQGTFLPETLDIKGNLKTQIKKRGIFEVPLYTATLDLNGTFLRPDLNLWGVRKEDILWDQSELIVEISDVKAIQNQVDLKWNNKAIPFLPGTGKFRGTNTSRSTDLVGSSGIYTPLKAQMDGDRFTFSIPLVLQGSENLRVTPFGKVTNVTIASDWHHPSFQGSRLPKTSKSNAQGFTANWSIPSLGRNYAQQWNSEGAVDESLIQQSGFGVDLISPIDNYRMNDRSIKYNILFLLLTFVVLWLFELTAGLRIHPLQYILVGAAMCMFYMLQLAISEHIGFNSAYAISSFAVIALITSYTMTVLRAKRRGGIVGIMQAVLYAYLYVVLSSQDYSLLIGSIGLFGFLAVIMYCTRRIDWNEAGRDRQNYPIVAADDRKDNPVN